MVAVRGIPCRLKGPASRKVVADVLRQIDRGCPGDFERLRKLVKLIRPLSRATVTGGCTGLWSGTKGTIELPEVSVEVDSGRLAALAAHEFGHACTREEDINRRNAPEDHWASESAANWYAYRWGFGQLVRALPTCFDLHGLRPGESIEIEGVGSWRMSRNFVYHPIDSATA
jgi:hypothetical protein